MAPFSADEQCLDMLVSITAAISDSHSQILVVDKDRAATYDLEGESVVELNSSPDVFKFPRPALISPGGQCFLAVHGAVQQYDAGGVLLEDMQTVGCAFFIFVHLKS